MIPFYILYTAFVPMHANFAVTIYRIGLRYRCLNNIISDYATAGEMMKNTIQYKIQSLDFWLGFLIQWIGMAIFDQITSNPRMLFIGLWEFTIRSVPFWTVYPGDFAWIFFHIEFNILHETH